MSTGCAALHERRFRYTGIAPLSVDEQHSSYKMLGEMVKLFLHSRALLTFIKILWKMGIPAEIAKIVPEIQKCTANISST